MKSMKKKHEDKTVDTRARERTTERPSNERATFYQK